MGNMKCNSEAVLAVSKRTMREAAEGEVRKQNEKEKKNLEREEEAYLYNEKYMATGEVGRTAKDWKKY